MYIVFGIPKEKLNYSFGGSVWIQQPKLFYEWPIAKYRKITFTVSVNTSGVNSFTEFVLFMYMYM